MQRRVHLNGRKIDLRQGRDRQKRKGHQSDEPDRSHQQRRRDRPLDEWLRDIHEACACLATGGAGCVTVTFAFCRSLYWPLTTTRSPAASPEVMIVRSPVVGPDVIGRAWTTSSSPTTQVNIPSGPR